MKKTLSITLSLLLLATVLVSCGGKEEAAAPAESKPVATTTTTTTTPAETTPAETKAEEPKAEPQQAEAVVTDEGVKFVISNSAEPQSLDPAKVQGVPEHRILMALFEGLTSIDPKTADPVPGLAESWEANEDGTQYTFHLRHATWSDGVPITAQDVVWSWLRELDPATAAPYAWFPCMFLKGAQEYNDGTGTAADVGIRALDDYTFQMDLIGPLPYAIGALEHYSFAVVPKHAIEKYGDQWTQPENFVGNGPFVLKERIPQSKIVCVPNPNYWDADTVKIDTLEYLASDDDNTNYNMYLDGQIDWLTNVPTDKLSSASMRDDYKASPQLATYYYVFQTQKAPLDNVNLRKAISYAIDREALVEGVTKAGQIPAWGIVPPMAGYEALEFPEEITIDGTTYDNREDAARAYLAKAGYPNGIGCPTLEILYNTSEGHKQIAEFIQQELKNKLNVNVELVNKEWGTYLTDRNAGNFEISRAGWVGDYQDPNTFLDMFLPGSAMNGGKYANEDYALFVKEAATISDPVERLGVLRTAEDIMVNEDAAIMPLYYYVTLNMIDTSVWGGWYTNTMDYHPPKTIFKK
ncbi:MAG: peptide ABC transporter substrate-binding protein [Pleomorphochaeta sp.]